MISYSFKGSFSIPRQNTSIANKSFDYSPIIERETTKSRRDTGGKKIIKGIESSLYTPCCELLWPPADHLPWHIDH